MVSNEYSVKTINDPFFSTLKLELANFKCGSTPILSWIIINAVQLQA